MLEQMREWVKQHEQQGRIQRHVFHDEYLRSAMFSYLSRAPGLQAAREECDQFFQLLPQGQVNLMHMVRAVECLADTSANMRNVQAIGYGIMRMVSHVLMPRVPGELRAGFEESGPDTDRDPCEVCLTQTLAELLLPEPIVAVCKTD